MAVGAFVSAVFARCSFQIVKAKPDPPSCIQMETQPSISFSNAFLPALSFNEDSGFDHIKLPVFILSALVPRPTPNQTILLWSYMESPETPRYLPEAVPAWLKKDPLF